MRKPYLGIWLDHKQAHLIWLDEDGESDLQHAQADYAEGREKTDRAASGRTGVYGGVAPHANVEDKRRRQARQFYEKIFRAVRRAENVYIFGPGQAKRELLKRLQRHKDFDGRIQAVESAEKMTQAQMAARVRKFFGLPRPVV